MKKTLRVICIYFRFGWNKIAINCEFGRRCCFGASDGMICGVFGSSNFLKPPQKLNGETCVRALSGGDGNCKREEVGLYLM